MWQPKTNFPSKSTKRNEVKSFKSKRLKRCTRSVSTSKLRTIYSDVKRSMETVKTVRWFTQLHGRSAVKNWGLLLRVFRWAQILLTFSSGEASFSWILCLSRWTFPAWPRPPQLYLRPGFIPKELFDVLLTCMSWIPSRAYKTAVFGCWLL